MADELEVVETEVEAVEVETEVETEQVETTEDKTEEVATEFESFDEEAAPASGEQDSGPIRQLREQNRKLAKQLKEATTDQTVETELGPKPKLEDFEYDEDAHEQAAEAWFTKKAELKQQAEKQQASAQAEQAAYETQREAFHTGIDNLGHTDAEVAKANVEVSFSQPQQAVLVMLAHDAPELTYRLGKSPKTLSELSAIQNPIELAARIGQLKGQAMTRRKAPAVEKQVSGNASVASDASDKKLAALEKQADKSGDRSQIIAYKASLEKAA